MICDKHGEVKSVYIFGKYVCRVCYMEKPHKKGNSGMLMHDYEKYMDETVDDDGIFLKLVKKSNPLFSSLYLTHYPGSKGIVGRSLCYLIYYNHKFAGIISASSPPPMKIFHNYFEMEKINNNIFLNNNAYRLENHTKNLGTQVLRAFRKRIKEDYFIKYHEKLIGLITFVEPPRTGAVYKADNWTYLGETEGKKVTRRGKNWMDKQWTTGTKN